MKRSFRSFFKLSEEVIEHALENSSDIFTKEDLTTTDDFLELTKIDDEEKFQLYFPALFRYSVYTKENKYKFLWSHHKAYTYIAKNKIELWLGENVSEEKKKQLNRKFPLYKIFVYANNLNNLHKKKIEQNDKVYTELDYEFTLIFKYFEAIYEIFFYLEKKTDKKNQLREISNWAKRQVTGEKDDEIDFEEIKKQSIEKARQMDIRATMKSMGIEIPEEFDVESIVEKAFDDNGSSDIIENMMKSQDFSNINEGISEFGNPYLEEVDEEIYEEIEDNFEDNDEVD